MRLLCRLLILIDCIKVFGTARFFEKYEINVSGEVTACAQVKSKASPLSFMFKMIEVPAVLSSLENCCEAMFFSFWDLISLILKAGRLKV